MADNNKDKKKPSQTHDQPPRGDAGCLKKKSPEDLASPVSFITKAHGFPSLVGKEVKAEDFK